MMPNMQHRLPAHSGFRFVTLQTMKKSSRSHATEAGVKEMDRESMSNITDKKGASSTTIPKSECRENGEQRDRSENNATTNHRHRHQHWRESPSSSYFFFEGNITSYWMGGWGERKSCLGGLKEASKRKKKLDQTRPRTPRRRKRERTEIGSRARIVSAST